MMNLDECRTAAADAIAQYGEIAYICPNCGDAYSGMPDWGYCDSTIDCTAPWWYDVAADAIVYTDDVDSSCDCGEC